MALTILSNPSDTCSVSSEMLFIINEDTKANDEVTYPNYKYLLDVYVDAVLVARMLATPDPVNRFGIFDISKVLQDYVPAYGFDITTNKVDYDVRVAYTCKLGEEYSDTRYTNLVTDSERYAFRTYKARPFTSSAIIANGLASNMPSTVNVYTPSLYKIIPYFSNVSGVTDLTITYKDKNDATLSTDTVSNSDFTANKIRQFNVTNSNSQTSYALLTGPFSLRINYECSKFDSFTLVWLNPFGAYDSQDFWLVSKKSIVVEKKTYQKLPYQINVSGEVSYNDNGGVFYGSKRDFNSIVKTKMNLTSHLLNEDEYTWLSELFVSPEIYIYLAGTGFVPVSLKGEYEYRNYMNSRLKPLEFAVEFSDDYNSQLL
jgi:hypothetical protein